VVVVLQPGGRVEKDLVCGDEVNRDGARFFSEYGGQTYYFCSAECKRAFDDHPDRHIRRDAHERLGI